MTTTIGSNRHLQSIILVVLLAGLGAGLGACEPVDNSWEQAILRCGDGLAANKNYLWVNGVDGPIQEAVGFDGQQVENLTVRNESCLELPKSFSGQLLIKNNGLTQRLELAEAGRFTIRHLQDSTVLPNVRERYRCPAATIHSQGAFKLNFSQEPMSTSRFDLHRLTIIDESGTIKLQAPLTPKSHQFQLSDFADEPGRFTMRVETAEAFELARGLNWESHECQLIVDTTPPQVSSSLDQASELRPGLLRVDDGQPIAFHIDDTYPKGVYYCLGPYSAATACLGDQAQFQKFDRTLYPPKTGLWRLSYYAEDLAGQRSAVKNVTFGVYHPQQTELIRQSLANSALKGLAGRTSESLTGFESALSDWQELSLPEERNSLYWDLLSSFWQIEENLTQQRIFELANTGRLKADPYRNRVAGFTQTRNLKGSLIDKAGLVDLGENLIDIAFHPDGRYALARTSGEVVVYDGLNHEAIAQTKVELNCRRRTYCGGPIWLPDNRLAIWDKDRSVVIETDVDQQLSVQRLLTHENPGGRPVGGFYPNYQTSFDQEFLIFTEANHIRLIHLAPDQPSDLEISFELTSRLPCGIKNAFVTNANNAVILTTKSDRLSSQAPEDHKACGQIRWRPKDQVAKHFPYNAEIAYEEYNPEVSYFGRRDNTLSFVTHNEIGSEYLYGQQPDDIDWTEAPTMADKVFGGYSESWTRWNEIDVTEARASTVSVKQNTSKEYLMTKNSKELVVTSMPYVKLPAAAVFRREQKDITANALLPVDDRLIIADEDKIAVHSLDHTIQGAIDILKAGELDGIKSAQKEGPLFAWDSVQQRAAYYDWYNRQLILTDAYFNQTAAIALAEEAPTALRFVGTSLIWANRQGELRSYSFNEDTIRTVATDLGFVQMLLAPGSQHLLIQSVSTSQSTQWRYVRVTNDGLSAETLWQSPSTLPRFTASSWADTSPDGNRILTVQETGDDTFELTVVDRNGAVTLNEKIGSPRAFFGDNSEIIFFGDKNSKLIAYDLAAQTRAIKPLANSALLKDVKAMVVDQDQLILDYKDRDKDKVFRIDQSGNVSPLAGLDSIISYDSKVLIGYQDQHLKVISRADFRELASTRLKIKQVLPLYSQKTTLEIVVAGARTEDETKRFHVRRLSLDPTSIVPAIKNWQQAGFEF